MVPPFIVFHVVMLPIMVVPQPQQPKVDESVHQLVNQVVSEELVDQKHVVIKINDPYGYRVEYRHGRPVPIRGPVTRKIKRYVE
jgi:hypothetical protein